MQPELLPLFPLSVVLFPRTQLPLHIFEDRYKDMIGEAIRNKSEFGIVLSSADGVASIGCTAIVDEVSQRYPDGRLDVVTVGLRRFEILELNDEKAVLRGTVEYFNDNETEAAGPDITHRALDGYKKLHVFLRPEDASEPEWQDPQLSFQLAQAIPDVEFRQQLLTSRSESERIRLLADFFPLHIAQQSHIEHIKSVAPTNGHGPHSVVD
jgi:ATP-dependent Lon protease